MTTSDQESVHFFGEYAPFYEGNDESEKKAKLYLELWKENFLFKHEKECTSIYIVDEQWSKRDASLYSMLLTKGILTLKIAVKIKYKFEVEDLSKSGLSRS